jgi:ABC-type multidrug transport system ATPase subunit
MLSRYVALQDTLSPYLTVEETLRFSARLRLPSDTLEQHLQAFIEEVGDSKVATEKRAFLGLV